jgi:hypothetical protein
MRRPQTITLVQVRGGACQPEDKRTAVLSSSKNKETVAEPYGEGTLLRPISARSWLDPPR